MKIDIGPYNNWVGPYQIAEKLLFWMDKENDDRVHNFGRWLSGGKDKDSFLHKICLWIESKKKRKIKIHIDKYDTWNMDGTLALIILPMLKQLKETQHGAPGDMPEFSQTDNGSSQSSFEFYKEGDSAAWDAGHKRWEEILDKMIWSFEQRLDDNWDEKYWITHPVLDMDDYPEDEGKTCFPVRWKVKGECDWEGRQKHVEKMQEGFELFGKYYQNLWD